MKRIATIILSLAAAAALAASCTAFLTEEPKTFVSPDQYYTTDAEIVAATTGCYISVATLLENYGFPGAEPLIMFERLTGNVDYTYGGSGNLALPLSESNADLDVLWSYYYSSIENCNGTIAGIEKSEAALTPEVKNRCLAEVHFLRAYYYFNLVRLFGPVPYKTTVTSGVDNSDLPCDSEETVYAGIVDDLKKAESLFPASDPFAATDGRTCLGATKALLAKVYLTMAGYPLQKKECYKLAYDKGLEVINAGVYTLCANHTDWRNSLNSNGGENIFSIQSDVNNATSYLHRMMLPYPSSTHPGGSVSLGEEYGGMMIPTVNFYNAFPDNDERKSAYFYTSYPSKDDASVNVEFTRPFVFKYFDTSAIATGKSGYRLPIIRLADVLLDIAEAACAGASTDDVLGVAAYNLVHMRAIAGETVSTITADMVFCERFYELCYEGQNWYDMVRTRKAFNPGSRSAVDMIGYQAETFTQPYRTEDLYAPYPLRETRLNPNLKR